MADKLLRSAGYQDQDAAPIIPAFPGAAPTLAGPAPDLGPNYNPTTPVPAPQPEPGLAGDPGTLLPDSPAVGANAGIETQRIE